MQSHTAAPDMCERPHSVCTTHTLPSHLTHSHTPLTLPLPQVLSLGDGNVYKTVLQDSEAWENPRPPTEITFSVEARCLAYDGRPGTGFLWHSTPDGKPIQIQMGTGQLPAGLAAALGQMSVGEVARYIMPAESMREAEECADGSEASTSGRDAAGAAADNGKAPSLLLPFPPKGATQVELTVYLFELVQVRDLTGDGGVTKRRLRAGDGEFPMDCPLRDTTVTLHYRVRQAGSTPSTAAAAGTSSSDSSSSGGGWLYDSCQAAAGAANGDASSSGNGNSSSSAQQPWAPGWGGAAGAVTVDTGCGELPEGLEMCAKLMVPLEVARVIAAPKYGYQVGEGWLWEFGCGSWGYLTHVTACSAAWQCYDPCCEAPCASCGCVLLFLLGTVYPTASATHTHPPSPLLSPPGPLRCATRHRPRPPRGV
jgi:hypothetical protein